ncbi:hypothetical protein BGZ92_009764 [Podila epicladia]|nr:hypothetical protein BGZ92_009764 [Podila epicladia]
MPALPSTPVPCLVHSLHEEDWPLEAQKVKDEQIQAFYREYAKRITAALTQYTTRGAGKALPEEMLRHGSSPSPQELMELYATLLRDNLDPQMREVLTDQSFATSTLGLSHAEQLDHHFRQLHQASSSPCACGADHGDGSLDFPEDSYEDEPDDEDEEDDEDEDEDHDHEGEEDDDSMDDDEDIDDEVYDDEDDEQDVVDGYAHHYEESNVKMMAYEEEKLKLEAVRRVREEERRLKEEFQRILLLQRLRLEDEERRKREAHEKLRREKLEEEMRKKREAAEADQAARSFLFQCTSRSQIETVKQMVRATPADSCSLTGVPQFATTAATRLVGWEFMTIVEGVGEVSEERGIQETLLHVAVRVGCADLAVFFIDKGAPLDALDSDGLTPLHTAAKHVSPFEICKLLVEKTVYHIDRTCITSGKTALHYASQNGYADLVALLLQNHARINAQDVKGHTPESLAKAGLESCTSDKASKGNAKQANATKAQKYRNTLQHLQKAMAAIKEAQSRKDALIEEQRKKDEALAREEAEKDNAAKRKQEEKLEADLRRRLAQEKELERLKAMASDPSGNNNNSNKKKKKKNKGGRGNDSQSAKETGTPPTPAPASVTAKIQSTSEPSPSSPGISQPTNTRSITAPSSSTAAHAPVAVFSPTLHEVSSKITPPNSSSSTKTAPPTSTTTTTTATATTATTETTQQKYVRIPKPKTSYRPSHLVVTRMTDMGFPLRDSRKALIQTEGRVEDAIDLLTSGAQLADDSEDEAEQAAEAAKAKARARAVPKHTPNGHGPPGLIRPNQYQSSPSFVQHQHQHQQPPHMRQVPHSTGIHPAMPRPPMNQPVQILQRTHAPHVQRSVPTQVLQRPPQNQPMAPTFAARKSFSNQGGVPAPMAMSSPVSHPATTIASFIAPRTVQPLPPTRAPYTYGPPSSTVNSRPITSPTSSHLRNSTSVPNSALDKQGMARKFSSMDQSGSQGPDLSSGQFGSGSSFSSGVFPTAASTWDASLNSKNMTPSSMELPAPISTGGFQPSMMGQHNLWASPGLSLPAPLLQSNMSSVSVEGISSSFGSPFLTSLPTPNHHPRSSTVGSNLDGRKGGRYHSNEPELDLANAEGEMIKDVLAMTGAIDSEEFANLNAEYSLSSGPVSSASSAGPSSRAVGAVGGGRNNSINAINTAPMSSLWGTSDNHSGGGLPSPIGTVNGHTLLGSRRGQDSGLDNSPNGSSDKGGVSEYSQWNSGFALEQTMPARQHSGFTDRFFGSSGGGSNMFEGMPSSPFDFHMGGGANPNNSSSNVVLALLFLQVTFALSIEPGTYYIENDDGLVLSIGPIPRVYPPPDVRVRLLERGSRDVNTWKAKLAEDGGVVTMARGKYSEYRTTRGDANQVFMSIQKAPQTWSVNSVVGGKFVGIKLPNDNKVIIPTKIRFLQATLQLADGLPDQKREFI